MSIFTNLKKMILNMFTRFFDGNHNIDNKNAQDYSKICHIEHFMEKRDTKKQFS